MSVVKMIGILWLTIQLSNFVWLVIQWFRLKKSRSQLKALTAFAWVMFFTNVVYVSALYLCRSAGGDAEQPAEVRQAGESNG